MDPHLLLVVAREDADSEAVRCFIQNLHLAQKTQKWMEAEEASWNKSLDIEPDRSLLPGVR